MAAVGALRPSLAFALAAGLAVAAVCLADEQRTERDQPLDTDLVERAESRLVQLDVTVTGPPGAVENLTRADFMLKVNAYKVEDFAVDRLCKQPRADPSAAAESPPPTRPQAVARPTLGPTTFLFYFDQIHLTLYGRQRAIDLVRRLVPRLIADGNRGMIVSNAEALETFADLTSEPDVLQQALDRLEKDRDQWHLFAALEDRRVEEVVRAIETEGMTRAITVAKLHHADELWRAERDFRRFAMVLGRLATIDTPKVVVYLADTMRNNAGLHYVRMIADPSSDLGQEIAQGANLGALTSFDRVVNEASSHGVRLYTIQAEGLTARSSTVPTTIRVRDAQHTLSGLALETGGRAFLNGVRADKIADRILGDLSCLYLVSFPPAEYQRDVPLKVKLKAKRPDVEVQVRGRVVIQSERARLTSRLLAAFGNAAGADASHPAGVRPALIPTGYLDGTFQALVQVAVPGSDLPRSTWDLGASVVSRGRAQQTSGRLTLGAPHVPAVLQQPVSFAPGPFELVAVAHDVTTDTIASRQIAGRWPRPDAELAAFGPIAVLQLTPAAISRQEGVVTEGLVAYTDNQLLQANRPTALVAVVCRSRDLRGTLLVERTLRGAETVTFEEIGMTREDQPCAIVRDLIPTRTMTAGAFRYELRATQAGRALARAHRDFVVGR